MHGTHGRVNKLAHCLGIGMFTGRVAAPTDSVRLYSPGLWFWKTWVL